MTKKFWLWDAVEENTLRLEGVIAEDSWFGDEITPKQFKAELSQRSGDITVWVNSPGGDVFAAVELYNMLKEHNGKVTIKIDSLAASAASLVSMAGDEVLMTPSSMLMLHDPMSLVFGNEEDLVSCIDMLKEVKEAILNAYELKTGAQRSKLSQFMTNETWLSAKKAIEWGFADGILYKEDKKNNEKINTFSNFSFNSKAYSLAIVNKLKGSFPKPKVLEPLIDLGTSYTQLKKRLNLIK